MEEINFQNRSKIFILGAGASMDYSLPSWPGLNDLLLEKLNSSKGEDYKYKTEMIDWVSKTGEGKQYPTIDECIHKEARLNKKDGLLIEQELFSVMKDVLTNDDYKKEEEDNRWITSLNKVILNKRSLNLENNIAFISYNYDYVLGKNLLDYNNYLSEAEQKLEHKGNLSDITRSVFPILYPHSTFDKEEHNNLEKFFDTLKDEEYGITTTTHHLSGTKKIVFYERSQYGLRHYNPEITLYILGLGAGLGNLDKINFARDPKNIHVTIFNAEDKEKVLKYLMSRFNLPEEGISIYKDCEELMEKAFKE